MLITSMQCSWQEQGSLRMKVPLADIDGLATYRRQLGGLRSSGYSVKDKTQGPLNWTQSSCSEFSFKLINSSTLWFSKLCLLIGI